MQNPSPRRTSRGPSIPLRSAKYVAASATMASPATAPASASHFSCCRTTPRERRSRTDIASAARPTETAMNNQPKPLRASISPRGPSASGFDTFWKGSSSGPARSPYPTTMRAIPPSASQSAPRHRRDGSRPSGNSSTASARRPKPGGSPRFWNQAATEPPGSSPGTMNSARSAYWKAKSPAPIATPVTRKIGPIGLPGTRVVIRAPTVAKVSEATTNDKPPTPLRPNESARVVTPAPRTSRSSVPSASSRHAPKVIPAGRRAVMNRRPLSYEPRTAASASPWIRLQESLPGSCRPPVRDPLRNRLRRAYRGAVALAITLLGPPRVEREGRPVTFDTRKAVALLAHLTLAERPRSRESLCGLLWPAHDLERGRGALRRTLSTLRQGIGDDWIDVVGDSLAVRRAAGLEVDVERFRALAADGATRERLSAAAALFAGDFLEGFSLRDSPEFDDWRAAEADALERELASVLRRLIEQLAAAGDLEPAIPHARRWLELDPLHEPAHRELIRLYAWSGDRAAAFEQYRTCVRTLSQELGVAPLEETAVLYEQLSEGRIARPLTERAPEATAPAVMAGAPPELPLLGRDDELAALLAAHAAATPDGRLAVIEGEPGIGKTRLARELADRATAAGATLLAARCHDDEVSLPYGPIVELLREAVASEQQGWPELVSPQHLADASLLLPELASLRSLAADLPPLGGPGAQVRLLQGVAAVITAVCGGDEPGLLWLDDVHAAYAATLDVISYLGRRLRGRALLIALTWRSEAVAPGDRLRRLAGDLSRDGRATIVRPGRLTENEVAALVHAVYPAQAATDLQQRVYVDSEGLPLFVAEQLAALHAGNGDLEDGLGVEVRSVLDTRLSGLSDVARQVLSAASAIGRSFDLDSARQASGRSDEEAVAALEELVGRGLVRELPGAEPAYDFSHDKLRERVYEQTSLARRRLLHERVAAVLARRRPGGEGAASVAHHLSLAGDRAGAAEQYRRAAEHAASLHAHVDALEHLEAALALGYAAPAAVLERIGDLRTLLGDYRGALASYESAAAQCEPTALAAIEHKAGGVHLRRGEWERAEARLDTALAAAPSEDLALRARIHADLSLVLHHVGRGTEAAASCREALVLAEAADDRDARAQAHNILGVLARTEGDSATAREQLELSLELARELGDPAAEAAALNNLALVERDAGGRQPALELTERALALCGASGDRHREAALENNLADLLHAAGDEEAAMTHMKRAVAIFSEVGADEATRLPEIWKLVSW